MKTPTKLKAVFASIAAAFVISAGSGCCNLPPDTRETEEQQRKNYFNELGFKIVDDKYEYEYGTVDEYGAETRKKYLLSRNDSLFTAPNTGINPPIVCVGKNFGR